MEQYLKQGLISDSKVLDIRQVDVRLLGLALMSANIDLLGRYLTER